MSDALSVGVIGAGLAGLAAARALSELGRDVVVFEKARGPGGRCASRRATPFAFDHGAQYFTARDADFRRALDAWSSAEVVARWDGRIVALQGGGTRSVSSGTERFVGTPSMNALAKHLARDVEVRCGSRIASIERAARAWRLTGEDGVDHGVFSQLVVTAPPAQAAALIGHRSPLGARAASIEMRPCWAVLLGLADRYEVEFDGAFCEDAALSWVARDSSKPGRPAAEAWVLHASPEWTARHLDDDPDLIAEALAAALERLTRRALPRVLHRDAHRWRFALPGAVLDDGSLLDRERGLVLAGDAYSGGRIEGAYLSGVAAAQALAT